MSNKIKPSEIADKINEYLTDWHEDITEEVEKVVTEASKEAKDELIRNSTSMFGKSDRSTPYATGWSVLNRKGKRYSYTKQVWNKTNYQLTHLLEFGHLTRNGGRTRKFEHIRPVEDKLKKEIPKRVEKAIKEANNGH